MGCGVIFALKLRTEGMLGQICCHHLDTTGAISKEIRERERAGPKDSAWAQNPTMIDESILGLSVFSISSLVNSLLL